MPEIRIVDGREFMVRNLDKEPLTPPEDRLQRIVRYARPALTMTRSDRREWAIGMGNVGLPEMREEKSDIQGRLEVDDSYLDPKVAEVQIRNIEDCIAELEEAERQ